MTSAALYYLLSTTLAASALFLLVELVERVSIGGSAQLAETGFSPTEDTNLDLTKRCHSSGGVFLVSAAMLRLMFVTCFPCSSSASAFSGFIAEVLVLGAVVDVESAPGLRGADGMSSSG